MKILFVIRSMRNGGAERVVSVLSEALAKNEDSIVGVLIFNTTPEDYYISEKVHVFRPLGVYDETKGNPVARKLKRMLGIRNACIRFKPDVIIPFLDDALIETYWAVGRKRIPIVATVRNNPEKSKSSRKSMVIYILKKVSAVCFQTSSQMQFFDESIRKKGFVMNNPVDTRFLEAPIKKREESGRRTIVSVGRLVKQKNHALLINAMIRVHYHYPDFCLKIYGDGPDRYKLQEKIRNENASGYISLEGKNANLEKIYNSEAYMFVLSSDYEGFPNALAEAMAMGLPCVSTDCPTGPRELLEGNRGVLTKVNDVDELYQSMIMLIENVKKADDYGIAARRYVLNNLTPTIIADRFLESLCKIAPWNKRLEKNNESKNRYC